MTKIRVIPTLLYNGMELVKGEKFDSWRQVGSPMQAVKVYNMREVDELLLLDINASREGRRPDFATIDALADECFMPFAVGGGIRDSEDVRLLLRAGADKVVMNSAFFENPSLVHRVTDQFGSQCVVVSIDARRTPQGMYECFTHAGSQPTGKDPVKAAQEAERNGAGEIIITSIDRDGMMEGYDVELIRRVSDAVSIPIIASGGAGSYEDMYHAVMEGRAHALAAASMYHFTHQTPLEAKRYLRDHGLSVRL